LASAKVVLTKAASEAGLNLFLDTNVLSKVIRGKPFAYRQEWSAALKQGHTLHTSVIVYFELEFGALNSDKPDVTRAKFMQTIQHIKTVHDIGIPDVEVAAQLRLDLGRRGLPIGEYDVLIAAQALRLGFPIVTNNRKHFERVPDLEVIDWA
jgi:tRNA(fMet)-specific endonuclease VapC